MFEVCRDEDTVRCDCVRGNRSIEVFGPLALTFERFGPVLASHPSSINHGSR